MSNPIITAQRFLKGLHEEESVEILSQLLDELENKSDPDPNEILLVSELYSLIETLKNVENNLRGYIGESMNLQGSKLAQLWEQRNLDGFKSY